MRPAAPTIANARARPATTSMITAPTMASRTCVWMTRRARTSDAGSAARGRASAEARRDRQDDERVQQARQLRRKLRECLHSVATPQLGQRVASISARSPGRAPTRRCWQALVGSGLRLRRSTGRFQTDRGALVAQLIDQPGEKRPARLADSRSPSVPVLDFARCPMHASLRQRRIPPEPKFTPAVLLRLR